MSHEVDAKDITKLEKDSKTTERLLTESERLMPELRTLVYCQQKAVDKGFKENFNADARGLVCSSTNKVYSPSEIDVVDYYRFEGITDPADMSVLYVIETSDGTKGTLVDAYGTYSDPEVAKIIVEVESISKKNTQTNRKA